MIVVDTNVVAYLLLPTRWTDSARKAHERDAEWRVPVWWRAEFVNLLCIAVRAGRVEPAQATAAWGAASRLLRRGEGYPSPESVLATAIRDGTSAYDAWFVALADRLDVPLVTADQRLVRARPDRAVLLEDFAG